MLGLMGAGDHHLERVNGLQFAAAVSIQGALGHVRL